MAMREVDALGDAIAATENEIFGEAFGKEEVTLDETGDRSIEQMGDGLEGQHEPDEDEEEAEGEEESGEDEGEQTRDDKGKFAKEKPDEGKEKPDAKAEAETGKEKPEGRVPSGKLREANERARVAEAERDRLKAEHEASEAKSRTDIAELKARFDGVLAALQRQQPTQQQDKPKTETAPDMFEDPEGFRNFQEKRVDAKLDPIAKQLADQRVEFSMMLAHTVHKDAFTKAFEAVSKLDRNNPDDRVTVQRIYASPNPGEALVQWHKRNETLREVGDDPAKYREKIATEAREALMKDPEFRKQLLEDLRAEASGANTGRPNTVTRLPKSLNGAAGGNTGRDSDPLQYDDSHSAVFDSAWRSPG